MKKVFSLVIDEDNEPLIVEEDEILEDILNSLESISNRMDDMQRELIMMQNSNDNAHDEDTEFPSFVDKSEIDF